MNYQQVAEVVLKVNDKDHKQKFEDAIKRQEELRKKFAAATSAGDHAALERISRDMNKVNREIANMQVNASNIKAAMQRLDQASPKELKKTIKLINDELNSGRVERGSKDWEIYVEAIRKAKSELNSVNDELEVQKSWFEKLKDSIENWQTMIVGGIAGLSQVIGAGKQAVNAYAEMEQEEANVRKFTGMTQEQVAALNEEFKKMDTRTSREELNQLAQEAGRLGKTSQEDVLGFVKAANQINVALDDLGSGATLELSKLTGIFGDEKRLGTEKSLLAVGSVINELSQNCTASAPYLADFSKRLAGVGAQAGMTIQQIMGFAAVLDTQGQACEMSATAFSQLVLQLYKDPSKFAKAAGLDVKQFSDLLKKDANEAVLQLIESLNKMGALDTLAPVFSEMGIDGARASAVLAALAGNIDFVREQQEVANEAFKEATSVTTEYNVQNETVEAGLEKAKKGFKEIAIELGEQLLPVMKYCLSTTSIVMRVLASTINFIAQNKAVLISLTASIAAYTIAVNFAAIKTKYLAAAATIANTASKLWHATLLLSTAAFSLFTGNTHKASVAMRAFNIAVKANPIGLIISAIGLLVTAITAFVSKTKQAREEQERLRQEMNKYKNSLRDINQVSADYAKDEIARLKALYEEAINEAKSKDARIAAAKKLQELYPDYFGNMSTEQIMLGNAIKQYKDLTNAIILNARARAAADKIKENESNILDLEIQRDELEDFKKKGEHYRNRKSKELSDTKKEMDDASWDYRYPMNKTQREEQDAKQRLDKSVEKYKVISTSIKNTNNLLKRNQTRLDDVNAKIAENEKANNELAEKYKDATKLLSTTVVQEPGASETPQITYTPTTGGLTKSQEKEQRKAEAAARKAAAAARKALDEQLKKERAARDKQLAENEEAYQNDEISYAKYMANKDKIQLKYLESAMAVLQKKGLTDTAQYADLLKKHEELQGAAIKRVKDIQLKELKAAYNTESAANQIAYNLGEKSYLDYIDRKRTLDQNYLADRIRIYEEAGLTETEEYAQLLKDKADAETKALENQRKKNLKILKNEHEQQTDMVTEALFDPNSPMFGNQRAYNQALLDEDVRYLTAKRDLFAKDSEEWIAANNELNDRINKDQLDKKKEAHEMLLQYSKEYREKDRAGRLKAELELLTELHKQGLISEEAYQEAVAKIKKHYRDEENDERKKNSEGIKTEYNDMVNNLHDSFKNLFESLKEGGGNMWNNIAEAATAAFAVMSAAMSAYSAYTDAERDLELAKVEKRYDKEIAAAGKNTKKKEKLEKQKEEETAKIKKKYLKKSQKIELAQAIASTALAAINSYASAAKQNWILGAVAAALATAAGAVQIATIKKQHQAEAEGYYEGGFTGGRDYRKEAGVVHGGEFVANHNAVNNPNLMPVLRLIDYAQRNNTVGSLTAEDVSNAIGQGRGVSARGEVARASSSSTPTIITNSIDTSALDRLNDRLDRGIEAHMIMDGEQGAYRKMKHYEQLLNNPRR